MKTIFVMLIGFLLSSQASAVKQRGPTIEQMGDFIAQTLAPHVITLSRDVHVYHWSKATTPNLEAVQIRHPMFANTALTNMKRFWLVAELEQKGAAGMGLYAAIDPFSSKDYGTSLIEITLKRGSRVLLLSNVHGLIGTMNRILSDNVEATVRNHWTGRDYLILKRLVAQKLGIVAFTYHYSNDYGRAICDTEPSRAFVIIGDSNTNRIPTDKIEVVGLVKRQSRESDEAAELYERVGNFGRTAPMSFVKMKLGSHFSPLTEAQTAYWREHLFACDRANTEDFVQEIN